MITNIIFCYDQEKDKFYKVDWSIVQEFEDYEVIGEKVDENFLENFEKSNVVILNYYIPKEGNEPKNFEYFDHEEIQYVYNNFRKKTEHSDRYKNKNGSLVSMYFKRK